MTAHRGAATRPKPATLALRWRRWALEALVMLALVLTLILGMRTEQQQRVADGPAPPLAGMLPDGRSIDIRAAANERPGRRRPRPLMPVKSMPCACTTLSRSPRSGF